MMNDSSQIFCTFTKSNDKSKILFGQKRETFLDNLICCWVYGFFKFLSLIKLLSNEQEHLNKFGMLSKIIQQNEFNNLRPQNYVHQTFARPA